MTVYHKYPESIFDSFADVLVVPVNCVGSMGKGLALAVKLRYPAVYEDYQELCATQTICPGNTVITYYLRRDYPKAVAFLPTKNDWREKSTIGLVASGLVSFAQRVYDDVDVTSVAIPALGCGAGGLVWADVQPRIEGFAALCPHITTHIYPPPGC
jgi:O-acetyl-ADP-ribose deacetylase (regulator of RNase III)